MGTDEAEIQYKMLSEIKLSIDNKVRKFKMAAISLNKKYKLYFLHPQMSSIWAEYALHVPPDALVYFCSLESTACEKVVSRTK